MANDTWCGPHIRCFSRARGLPSLRSPSYLPSARLLHTVITLRCVARRPISIISTVCLAYSLTWPREARPRTYTIAKADPRYNNFASYVHCVCICASYTRARCNVAGEQNERLIRKRYIIKDYTYTHIYLCVNSGQINTFFSIYVIDRIIIIDRKREMY